MDDIWIISWFNHTAFDANPIWKSPTYWPWPWDHLANFPFAPSKHRPPSKATSPKQGPSPFLMICLVNNYPECGPP